ncbi:MAG: class I SAM-dependent methyltransferase [Candidatus Latescibacterota bacterium]
MEDGCAAGYSDYKAHYTLDARSIVDPEALPPVFWESERRRLQTLVRLFGEIRGQRVLDVGCGSGWLTRLLAERGARVVALDMALSGVKGARHRVESRSVHSAFLVGDIYHLPFATDAFDGAVLSEVAEHLEDLDRGLEEIARLLKSGGQLVISVPNNELLRWHLCIHCNRLTPANAHIRNFTEKSLKTKLEDHGFTVLKVAKISNKMLEHLRFPVWTGRLPYPIWRAWDAVLNVLSRKSAFLAAVAIK